MSVAGFDFGSLSSVIALARKGGIDIALNEASGRSTPSLVAFSNQERLMGEGATGALGTNPKNTISQMKRLLGRSLREPEFAEEISRLAYKVEDVDGTPHVVVQYGGETRSFTPEGVTSMFFGKLKQIAEADMGGKVVDCVVSCPGYFTDTERRALLNATKIAGLNCLRLMNEPTAVGLAYGIYKTDLPEKDPQIVAFVDMGHAATSVSIISFVKGKLTVLGTAYDRNLGGRVFDEALARHFVDEWKAKHKIDPYTNPKAIHRVRVACEKLKKVLSSNSVGVINIECLMEDIDVAGKIERDVFNGLVDKDASRLDQLCKDALETAGISSADLFSVEITGGSTRVPIVQEKIQAAFGKELSRTLNADESVAKGCALHGAMLSPNFRVRDFSVNDINTYPISLSWTNQTGDVDMEADQSVVFPAKNPIPSTKLFTFYRSEPFELFAQYADASTLPEGTMIEVGRFQVNQVTADKDGEASKVKVKVKLNLSGIVTVDGAQMVHPIEEEADKMETDAPAEGSGDAAEKSEEAAKDDKEEKKEEKKEDDKAEEPKKKKVKRIELPVSSTPIGGLSDDQVTKAAEAEYQMALQDRLIQETQERKNALETYVYDMRDKISTSLSEFAKDSDKDVFRKALDAMEDWIYGDGEDVSKGVYIEKLAELKKMGDPMVNRSVEDSVRPQVLSSLQSLIQEFVGLASSADAKYDHISQEDKDKVLAECGAVEQWKNEMETKQASLAKHDDPAFTSNDVKLKRENLERTCRPIMNKPKPAPPKEEKKEEEKKEGEEKEGEEKKEGEEMEVETPDDKMDES